MQYIKLNENRDIKYLQLGIAPFIHDLNDFKFNIDFNTIEDISDDYDIILTFETEIKSFNDTAKANTIMYINKEDLNEAILDKNALVLGYKIKMNINSINFNFLVDVCNYIKKDNMLISEFLFKANQNIKEEYVNLLINKGSKYTKDDLLNNLSLIDSESKDVLNILGDIDLIAKLNNDEYNNISEEFKLAVLDFTEHILELFYRSLINNTDFYYGLILKYF